MLAIAARETYFITTPRMFGILERMIITLISTISEMSDYMKPMKKAG